MPELTLYEYAVVRAVPQVYREEFVNVGVVLYCRKSKFAATQFFIQEAKIRALCPEIEISLLENHLLAFQRICAGDKQGGPLAALDIAERFRWLTAKRSTIIQCSAVHPGLTADPQQTLAELFNKLVL